MSWEFKIHIYKTTTIISPFTVTSDILSHRSQSQKSLYFTIARLTVHLNTYQPIQLQQINCCYDVWLLQFNTQANLSITFIFIWDTRVVFPKPFSGLFDLFFSLLDHLKIGKVTSNKCKRGHHETHLEPQFTVIPIVLFQNLQFIAHSVSSIRWRFHM